MSAISFEDFKGNAAENYDRYFVPAIGRHFAEDLIAAARLASGERVLDVACGTGVVARLALEAVMPGGSVSGVDINPGMLGVARVSSADVDWRECSADKMPFDEDSFDAALCSLGVEFFDDRPAALAEVRRVLVPNGRFAFNGVGPTPEPFEVLADALGRHIKPEVAGFVRAVFSLYDGAEIQDLLDQCGFIDIDVESKTLALRLPNPRDFLWQYLSSTPLVQAIRGLDDDARAALEADVVSGWEPFTDGGSLIVRPDVTVATGRNQ